MSRFKVGDRVRLKGVKPDSPEYDTGTIVGFTFGNAKVHWESADEIYSENPMELEALAQPSARVAPGKARRNGR